MIFHSISHCERGKLYLKQKIYLRIENRISTTSPYQRGRCRSATLCYVIITQTSYIFHDNRCIERFWWKVWCAYTEYGSGRNIIMIDRVNFQVKDNTEILSTFLFSIFCIAPLFSSSLGRARVLLVLLLIGGRSAKHIN